MPGPRSLRCWVYPAVVWLIVLAAIFGTEYAIMLVLPWLLPGYPPFLEAAVDAVTLTARRGQRLAAGEQCGQQAHGRSGG
jgi:hypothetical protein